MSDQYGNCTICGQYGALTRLPLSTRGLENTGLCIFCEGYVADFIRNMQTAAARTRVETARKVRKEFVK